MTVTSGYWYDDADGAVQVLNALRELQAADEEMRLRSSRDMGLNRTDMRALRFVIAQEAAGEQVTAQALAAELGISTASVTKLLDRITRAGYLERRPHPTDRRSVVVRTTPRAHGDVRKQLGPTHERMLAIAEAVPAQSREHVATFLRSMAAELASYGHEHAEVPEGGSAG